ncbi:MAG TPA: DUF6305 family protein [Rectinema sp.]|jgi:hypothetical protein|nr:hypothetical protein [Spirochaetia bacterium]NLH89635.1 hypothetical protein [Treponema sp.]HNP93580.1 DUF6305 family protein [Rectinema sp.]HNT59294.1 DUF6305 family protein [Rectinema sp.]HNV35547.1 DUF6305 family protein [Rectinema sp.]
MKNARRIIPILLVPLLFFGGGAILPLAAYNLKTAFAPQPALLTSIGQSADVEMAKTIMARAKLNFTMDPTIKAQALASTNAKTLVIVIGGSSKGLGAAGISAEAELERTKALLAEAKKRGMKIIGLHIGGEARRGELSDRFINEAVPSCDYFIVVEEGNKDGLFTKLCGNKIPLDIVQKISQIGEPLAAAFLK